MTDTNNEDPLKVILVDDVKKQNRARELLANILRGRGEIDSKTGELELLPDAYNSSVADTILILLCGKLAQKLLAENFGKKESEIDEKMTQKEISDFLVTIEKGTIRSSLHYLRSKDRLIKNEDGKNFIASGQLQKIRERLLNKSRDKKNE